MATRLTFGLGILSLLAVGVSHLALTDIAHGTGGAPEWRALQISFALILLFQLTALVTLWRIMRRRTGDGDARFATPGGPSLPR